MGPPDSPRAAPTPVDALVETVAIVDSVTPCAEVEFGFRNRWTSSSILVVPTQRGGPPGIVSRSDFLSAMAGSSADERSTAGRRPIGELAAWSAPVLPSTATLGDAAALLVEGPDGPGPEGRHDPGGCRDLVVVDDGDRPVGIVRPVRVLQALVDRADQQATTDGLTRVASRNLLVERLTEALADIGARHGAVVVARVDLDRFDQVNAQLGHAGGDAVLRSVARSLGGALAPADLLGRMGGDEFAVVRCLPPEDRLDPRTPARRLGEQLRAAVARPDPWPSRRVHRRGSVGVAVTTSSQSSADATLFAARQAVQAAKAAGGDTVRLSDSADPGPESWAAQLRLEVVYQPIVDARTHRVVAVEALLRSRNADGGLDGPLGPLEDAARAGLSLDLDRWVLDRACRDMVRWQDLLGDAAPASVHVNLAADSLNHVGMAGAVLVTIDATGLGRRHVRLELSERSGMPELTAALAALRQIADAGVGIALDDLGATLDALRVIDSLPVDGIKIDRSLVLGAHARVPVDTEVLALLVRLGRRRGLQLVAEGVERPAEERTLLAAGVHLIQGFRYSRPVPPAEIERLTRPGCLTGRAGAGPPGVHPSGGSAR